MPKLTNKCQEENAFSKANVMIDPPSVSVGCWFDDTSSQSQLLAPSTLNHTRLHQLPVGQLVLMGGAVWSNDASPALLKRGTKTRSLVSCSNYLKDVTESPTTPGAVSVQRKSGFVLITAP